MFKRDKDENQLIDKVVFINRVAKVVKGGRRFSFSAIVVVGDGEGSIGYGLGKAGEVQTATVPVPDAIEHHKAGKIRILGVASTQRHFVAPDVKTFKEQGFDVVAGSWRTIVAPAGIPDDRLKILEDGLLKTLKDAEMVKRANNAGFFVTPMGSAETAAYWKSYDKAVYPVLSSAGLVKVRKK